MESTAFSVTRVAIKLVVVEITNPVNPTANALVIPIAASAGTASVPTPNATPIPTASPATLASVDADENCDEIAPVTELTPILLAKVLPKRARN
ncbi:hypothetical protein [Candidatus Spongiihabitans sp.]|uniref:hypothetical protein n=1 Tax=Candidatus Spongiihabitans sp. TaxID=3101308 RepID=UPI003C6F5AFA